MVIQGHRFFGTNRKRICDFLLIININFVPILHRFWDIRRLICWKLRIFPAPLLFGAPAPYDPFGISRWSHGATLWWKLLDPNFNRFWFL